MRRRIERVLGRDERGDDDFADFSGLDRIARAGPHDFDQHTLVDDQALPRFRLVRDRAQVRGGVDLIRDDVTGKERVAQAGRKRLAGHESFLDAGQLDAEVVGLVQDDFQE